MKKPEELKLIDEGYQTGKNDAIKECIMLVGTYGIKDPESSESKIYMQSREDAVANLKEYEPDISDWSWHEAYNEVMTLKGEGEEKDKRIKMLECALRGAAADLSQAGMKFHDLLLIAKG